MMTDHFISLRIKEKRKMTLRNFGDDVAKAMTMMSHKGHGVHLGVSGGAGLGAYAYAKHKGKKHPLIDAKIGMLPAEGALLGGMVYGVRHGESLAAKLFF